MAISSAYLRKIMGEIEARKRAVSDAVTEFSFRAARERLSQPRTRSETQTSEEACVDEDGGVWMIDDTPHRDPWEDPETIALYADADDPCAWEMSSKYLKLGHRLGGHLALSVQSYQDAKAAAADLNAAKALVPGLINWAKLLVERARLSKKSSGETVETSAERDTEANIIEQLAFYGNGFDRVAFHAKREADATRAALMDENLCVVARIKGEVIPTPKELARWLKVEATAGSCAARIEQKAYKLQLSSAGQHGSIKG